MRTASIIVGTLTALTALTISAMANALPAVQLPGKSTLHKPSLPVVHTVTITREIDKASPQIYQSLSLNEQLGQLGLGITGGSSAGSTPAPSSITQSTLDLDNRQATNTQPSPTWSRMSLTLHAQTVYPEEVFVGSGDIGFRIFNSQPGTTYTFDITCFNGMDTPGTITWQDSSASGVGGSGAFPSRQNDNFVFAFVAPSAGEADIVVKSEMSWIFDQAEITAIPASAPLTSN